MEKANIAQVLREVGVPSHLRGHEYLMEAVRIVHEDGTALKAMEEKVYGPVAETCQTTASRVERAIRHALEIAWIRQEHDADEVSNSAFVAFLADRAKVLQ